MKEVLNLEENNNTVHQPKLAKIAITQAANEWLEAMVTKVNDGWASGRVGKRDLATWIIKHFDEKLLARSTEKIRAEHFDSVAFLKSAEADIKSARRSGGSEAEMRKVVASKLAELEQRSKAREPKAEPREVP